MCQRETVVQCTLSLLYYGFDGMQSQYKGSNIVAPLYLLEKKVVRIGFETFHRKPVAIPPVDLESDKIRQLLMIGVITQVKNL
jgi:hypothetical protein